MFLIKPSSIAIALSVFFSFANVTQAALLTSDTIVSPSVIDFSDQPSHLSPPGPLQIGGLVGEDITVAGTPDTGVYANPFL